MSIRVTLTRPTRGPTRNRSTASDCDGTDLLLFIGTADLDLLIGGSPADAIAIATNIAGEKRVLSTTEGTPQGERSHPLCPKVLELGIHHNTGIGFQRDSHPDWTPGIPVGERGKLLEKGCAQKHQWRPPLRSGNEPVRRRDVVGVVVVRRLPCFEPARRRRRLYRCTKGAYCLVSVVVLAVLCCHSLLCCRTQSQLRSMET